MLDRAQQKSGRKVYQLITFLDKGVYLTVTYWSGPSGDVAQTGPRSTSLRTWSGISSSFTPLDTLDWGHGLCVSHGYPWLRRVHLSITYTWAGLAWTRFFADPALNLFHGQNWID